MELGGSKIAAERKERKDKKEGYSIGGGISALKSPVSADVCYYLHLGTLPGRETGSTMSNVL